jgi:predicted RNA-binding Zn ribbon-like protein
MSETIGPWGQRIRPMHTNEGSAASHLSGSGEDTFLFIGDVLALDLVNTEVVVRGKPRDLLVTPEDVAQWWHAAQRYYPNMDAVQAAGVARVDTAALVALKGLRRALRGIFGALADDTTPASADIDVLNTVLRTGTHALMLTSSGAVRPVYQAQPGADPMQFAIALSALRLVRDGERQRLHRCSNNRCVLLFYDTTKSATRRWCSVGCMDRARSAKRYLATKQGSHS